MTEKCYITGDEFDCIHHVLTEKMQQYDDALTQLMIACRHEKMDKISKGQALYWQHCKAALKDTLSYARTLIRGSDARQTLQQYRPDNSEGRATVDSSQSVFWQDQESNH